MKRMAIEGEKNNTILKEKGKNLTIDEEHRN